MPRPYVMWPDPRLKAMARPIAAVDDDVRTIWDEMLEAVYAMPGIGLAAPQLGIDLRLAVVDCSTDKSAVRLANPEIVETGPETQIVTEGSPNLPGLFVEIERPSRVRVAYLDETGAQVDRVFEEMWATSIQHQIDHLDGKIFIDRLSPMRRRRALERHRKAQNKKRRA
ncbi:MAG: peptide deformylase [Pseudomonadota bacterium]